MRYLDAEAVSALGPARARQAIVDALRGGLDPSVDPARVSVPLSHGEFLLMPSEGEAAVGIKVVTIAPDNPGWGLPRIQAAYLLFDQGTLALRAVLDGTALTTLRTPAVSVAAVEGQLPERAMRVAVIGAGAGPARISHRAARRVGLTHPRVPATNRHCWLVVYSPRASAPQSVATARCARGRLARCARCGAVATAMRADRGARASRERPGRFAPTAPTAPIALRVRECLPAGVVPGCTLGTDLIQSRATWRERSDPVFPSGARRPAIGLVAPTTAPVRAQASDRGAVASEARVVGDSQAEFAGVSNTAG